MDKETREELIDFAKQDVKCIIEEEQLEEFYHNVSLREDLPDRFMCRRNWLRSWINGCGDPVYPTGPHAPEEAWRLYCDTYVALMRKAVGTIQKVYDYEGRCNPESDGSDYEEMVCDVEAAVYEAIGIKDF